MSIENRIAEIEKGLSAIKEELKTTFKRGDIVLVSDDKINWYIKIYNRYDSTKNCPHNTLSIKNNKFVIQSSYRYYRPYVNPEL